MILSEDEKTPQTRRLFLLSGFHTEIGNLYVTVKLFENVFGLRPALGVSAIKQSLFSFEVLIKSTKADCCTAAILFYVIVVIN